MDIGKSLRPCIICKKEFYGDKRKKFCSPECRVEGGRARERKYQRKYRLRNPEKIIKQKIEYRVKYGDIIKNYNKKYYQNNKTKCYLQSSTWRRNNGGKRLESWGGFIPSETTCQVCGKSIYFNKKNLKLSIHFDHKCGGDEVIKGSPYDWLRSHPRTPENEKIWNSCDFGMLCNKCNLKLPTKNRKQFLINAMRYSGITEKDLSFKTE